ncbi:MAG: hypothetical protein IJ736_07985, partial [Firmicutes bacterium]|nr:hypothetical protein [Bacillota bacterium]
LFNGSVFMIQLLKIIVWSVKHMNKIRETKRCINLKNWKEEIESQISSGLSVKEWCLQNNINQKSYYYHLRKVREASIEIKEKQEIIAVTEINKSISENKPSVDPTVIIRKEGIEIEIFGSTSAQMIQFLLQGLKSC